MAQQQLRIDFDREGKVTRRKIVSLSVHSGRFFVNLCYTSIVQPHTAMHFCVCELSGEKIFVLCHKTLKKSTLPFPDFSSFVAWVQLIFW